VTHQPGGTAEAEGSEVPERRFTRREALKRVAVLGLGASATAVAGTAVWPRGALAEATRAARVSAPVGTPALPPDVKDGLGAWRMIDWGGEAEVFTAPATWKRRGWGGFSIGFNYPYGLGGGTDFRGSSVLHDTAGKWLAQRRIEGHQTGGVNFADKCHAAGCEAYIGTRYRNAKRPPTQFPIDLWDGDTEKFAAALGRVAAMCNHLGLDGQKADLEEGYWGLDYPGNKHSEDENKRAIQRWGYRTGQQIFEHDPDCIMLVYDWHVPGGWAAEEIYGGNGKGLDPFYDDPWIGTKTLFWLGYLEAMADAKASDARLVVVDAFFYQGAPQKSGADLANALKYHTQGSMAYLSQQFSAARWSFLCDKVDVSAMGWAGTDTRNRGFYKHMGEPEFGDMLETFRRWCMGTRRGNFTLEGRPEDYCWIDSTTPDPKRRQVNNWYVVDRSNPPGGHVPATRRAGREEPIDSHAPTLTARRASKNSDGTFTIRGSTKHVHGIRCVHGYVSYDESVRHAARMTWNQHGGSYSTSYDDATQDYELTLRARPGDVAIVTAVSIHDQTHSVRVRI
jgi:hypothetical protein